MRTLRLEIENMSESLLRECRVREKDFINAYGHRSGQQRIFRLAEEAHADMGAHSYKQSFDLQGKGAIQIIEIACMDELNENGQVYMLYATSPTAQTKNMIPRHFFPHTLTVSVTSTGMYIAEQYTYQIRINSDGIPQMVPE